MLQEDLIERAFWLTVKEKKMIAAAMNFSYVKNLAEDDRTNLLPLLCSIFYAEKKLRSNGKKISWWIENTIKKLHLQKIFCATLGPWNFHVCHARRFGYSNWEFKKILEDEKLSTDIVIHHLVEDLGLKKSPDLIFAEYNLHPMATSVAALQRACNFFLQRRGEGDAIEEDGLIGPHSRNALKMCARFLPDYFCLDALNEKMILKTLEYFAKEHAVFVKPFVPQVIIMRDGKFLLDLLAKAMKNFSQLRKVPRILMRHIDVPTYVRRGMAAMEYLASGL